jgi:3-hydroxybutyrate dehydrogenase
VQKQIEDRAREAGVSLEQSARDIILAPVPTKEFVTVEQIAAAALFLAGDAGAQMNGATFVLDGGWTAR